MTQSQDPAQGSSRIGIAAARGRRRALFRDFSSLLFVAVVLPVVAIAAVYLWQSSRVARDQYETRLHDVASAHAREIEAFVEMDNAVRQVRGDRRRLIEQARRNAEASSSRRAAA